MKLSPEEKKQREILKWEKETAKAPGYLIYFLLIICVVYICDEVSTQISGMFFGPAMGALLVLSNALGDSYIGICTLATVVPGMLIGLVMMMLKVKETKGVDMGAVTAENE